MKRQFITAAFALVGAIPAFANTTKLVIPPPAAAPEQPVLRLMNDREFGMFLNRLDVELQHSELQLKKMDVKALHLDAQDQQDLERSFGQCLQSLDNTRDEIQKLSQKQTLKLDLYLLIDLNELSRNLDALDEILVNPTSAEGVSGAHKSLSYAHDVLLIDGSLASQITNFQHHFIAFTGVIDASIEEPEAAASQPSK